MRKILSLLTFLICTPAMAGELWVTILHTISDGKYSKTVLPGTEGGVSKIECEMRLEQWDARISRIKEIGKELDRKYGNPYEDTMVRRTTCEPAG